MIMLFSLNMIAQEKTITVKESDLTAEQLAAIQQRVKAEQTVETVKTYGKLAGIGKEIGTAVNEGLSAVVETSDKFSKTDVGKITIFLIGWKIMGRDAVRMVIAIILWLVLTIVFIKAMRVYFPRRIRVEGKWYNPWAPSKYEFWDPYERMDHDTDRVSGGKALTFICYLAGIAIIYAIGFA